MEKSDDQKFAGLMAMLATAFGQENTELRIEVYFDALQDFTIEEVEGVVYLAIKTLKFFPKVAELRELVEGAPEDRALLAWQMAVDTRNYYGGADFVDDPIIPYCLQEIFGGYMEFCEKTLDELKWEEKRFLNLYRLVLKRPSLVRSVSTKMKGLFQEDNEKKGLLEHVPPVPQIEIKPKEVPQIEAPKKEKQGA